MPRLGDVRRVLSTAKHLRLGQIGHRLLLPLRRPHVEPDPPPPPRRQIRPLLSPADRAPTMTGPTSVTFLGQAGRLDQALCWNDPSRDKLWLYHCHYFEDLIAGSSNQRQSWHEELIARWITDNPPGMGNGWEPYPLSLRISNWVLWAGLGHELRPAWRHSLAIQVRWLRRSIEWHLLANHVLANAKALVLAGCWAGGDEGDRWLQEGLDLLRRQVADQILPDGGHIERSPMYHAQVLNDLLDACNGLQAIGLGLPEWLTVAVSNMGSWLMAMLHPDGDIALFNDAAFGMAPSPDALSAYASRLGMAWPTTDTGSRWLSHSGYVRMRCGEAVVFCDVAPLGPDWQPAHGHADSLTWEASLGQHRMVVDPGTSLYGPGTSERLRQRGTGAHNTVMVDGTDSSEVWGGFRVARRARVRHVTVADDGLTVTAEHDGYRGRGVIHRRTWHLGEGNLSIEDNLMGRGQHAWSSGILLAPAVQVASCNRGRAEMTLAGQRIQVAASQNFTVNAATYHPAFGASMETQRLCHADAGPLPTIMNISLSWHACASAS